VSRRLLDKDVSGEINSSFVSLISSLKNRSEVENFLTDFLTREEKLMLAKRLAVSLMLTRGYTVGTICEVLKVSKETIRSSRSWLETKGETYKRVLEKLRKAQEANEFWKKVDKIIDKALLPVKPDRKSRAKWASGDWSQD